MAEPTRSLDDSGAFWIGRRPAAIGRILESVMQVGRGLLARSRPSNRVPQDPSAALGLACQQLLGHRGEASGLVLANDILAGYQALSQQERLAFFKLLSRQFAPDPAKINAAAAVYYDSPTFESLTALSKAVQAPRIKLFRRLNMVPGGTSRLVQMRGQLLREIRDNPELRAVDSDLRHLLTAWFNRGFLVMDRIDWSSSANVLEKIIAYEAVHEINGWDDLRARLADDRLCFAFFHPAMPDDPIIFVEIALTRDMATSIGPLIAKERDLVATSDADTAVFYSISNCHFGLRGISFGHFLIKQVIEELRRDYDNIRQFVTLSPVPGLRDWIEKTPLDGYSGELVDDIVQARDVLAAAAGPLAPGELGEAQRSTFMRLCAYYLLQARSKGEPLDPVARFHLGNGAALERVNWAADLSRAGIEKSAGIMVNYAYRLKDIEKNHELYFASGQIVASAAVRKLAHYL